MSSAAVQRPLVLLPVRVLTDEVVPQGLVDVLAKVRVLVLGYHELPEQTPPAQAREQFGQAAGDRLAVLAERFEAAGAEVETRLVFTGDGRQTITRVANEEAATAIVLPEPCQPVERVLVPMRGAVNLDRLIGFTAGLVAGSELAVTLLHVASEQALADEGRLLLDGARSRLVEAGVTGAQIEEVVVVSQQPVAAIGQEGRRHQIIVMGETEPSLASLLIGTVHDRVDEAFDGPMIVVRKAEHEGPAGQAAGAPGS